MTYELSSKAIPARFAAIKRFHATVEEMGEKMPEAFGAAYGYMMEHELIGEGPAVARYTPDGDAFEVEAGFYSTTPFKRSDGIDCIQLPACDAVTTTHYGPYETLPTAYEAIKAWAAEQGLTLSPVMWEEYWSDPQTTPPAEWRTDVIWPIAK